MECHRNTLTAPASTMTWMTASTLAMAYDDSTHVECMSHTMEDKSTGKVAMWYASHCAG